MSCKWCIGVFISLSSSRILKHLSFSNTSGDMFRDGVYSFVFGEEFLWLGLVIVSKWPCSSCDKCILISLDDLIRILSCYRISLYSGESTKSSTFRSG